MIVNHFSIFDVLYLTDRISGRSRTSIPEIHLFSYLSCLLSLYKGIPVSEWGYSFAYTERGFPYGKDLSEALDHMIRIGHISDLASGYVLSDTGNSILDTLTKIELYEPRITLLHGATSALSVLPLGMIRLALSHQLDIGMSRSSSGGRMLLNNTAMDDLYDQFEILSDALGKETQDIMIPAATWLGFTSSLELQSE